MMKKQGNIVSGGGACENPVRLSMHDGPMETVKYAWVNIWCMLDWIVGFCHKTAEIHFIVTKLHRYTFLAYSCSTRNVKMRPYYGWRG